MNTYDLLIESQFRIPHDVLVEHLSVAMRELNFTGRVNITMTNATEKPHPFDGPEVFDDSPELERFAGPADPYPLVTRAVDALKESRA